MDIDEFFSRVCVGMGWDPDPWRLEAFKLWASYEGMSLEQTWNPLATTWYFDGKPQLNNSFDIGYGPGNWNWVPVRVYATPEDGIQATILTLSQPAYYSGIRQSFQDHVGYPEAALDFSIWSGSGYSQAIVDGMNALPPFEEDTMTEELRDLLVTIQNQIRQLQDVIAGGPDGVQALWNDQGIIATGLGIAQGEIEKLRDRPICHE